MAIYQLRKEKKNSLMLKYIIYPSPSKIKALHD